MSEDHVESSLLRRLKSAPEIFTEIRNCSAEERVSQKRLRSLFGDELVRAALSVYDARERARGQLPFADMLWLNRVGLEQATAWLIAQHKAERFPSGVPVFDLCSGIGVDSTALAGRADVVAVDMDPAMCLRCEWNAAIWSPKHTVTSRCGDVTKDSWSDQLVHIDPDRRAGRDRPVMRLEQYQPDLKWLQELISVGRGGAIKLGPASNFMQKFPGCEIELISLDGECREATVWFGELAGPQAFRATTLSTTPRNDRLVADPVMTSEDLSAEPRTLENSLHGDSSPVNSTEIVTTQSISADPLSERAEAAERVCEWIFDPNPAVVRSGLLDVVAVQQGLMRLDPEEEYLTGDMAVRTDFLTPFQVEATLPNSLRELRAWLRADPSRYYEIKCRRIRIEAAAVQRQLPIGDSPPRVILFARVGGVAKIVVARRPADHWR